MFGTFLPIPETGGKAEPVARKTQGALVDEAPVLQHLHRMVCPEHWFPSPTTEPLGKAAVLFAYPRRHTMKAGWEALLEGSGVELAGH